MTVLNREEIEAILPHREPFLLIDEVLELQPGERSSRARRSGRTSGTWPVTSRAGR